MLRFAATLLFALTFAAGAVHAQQPAAPKAESKPAPAKSDVKSEAKSSGAAKPPGAKPANATSAPPSKPAAAKPAPPQTPEPKGAEAKSAAAKEDEASETATGTSEPGLPIPRFVSFRTDPVNLRTGPGVRYPVDWVYVRRRLPVEIIAEFETWRQIRDVDGAEGWVHQSMLSGRRTGLVRGAGVALRKTNADASDTLAMLEPGVVVDIQRCPQQGVFCRVEVSGLQGWLKREQIWGVYPQEVVE